MTKTKSFFRRCVISILSLLLKYTQLALVTAVDKKVRNPELHGKDIVSDFSFFCDSGQVLAVSSIL